METVWWLSGLTACGRLGPRQGAAMAWRRACAATAAAAAAATKTVGPARPLTAPGNQVGECGWCAIYLVRGHFQDKVLLSPWTS